MSCTPKKGIISSHQYLHCQLWQTHHLYTAIHAPWHRPTRSSATRWTGCWGVAILRSSGTASARRSQRYVLGLRPLNGQGKDTLQSRGRKSVLSYSSQISDIPEVTGCVSVFVFNLDLDICCPAFILAPLHTPTHPHPRTRIILARWSYLPYKTQFLIAGPRWEWFTELRRSGGSSGGLSLPQLPLISNELALQEDEEKKDV